MKSQSPRSRPNLNDRSISKVKLRFAQALREAGFDVEFKKDWGSQWLVYGFGQAALCKSLVASAKSVKNRLIHAQAFEYAANIVDVLKAYSNGEYLS